jgi:hypothetical protein
MYVKLGLSLQGKNADRGCLGKYLDLRGMKWQEGGEA